MSNPSAQEFVAALRRVEEHGDVETMAALYATDAELRNPELSAPLTGSEGARRFWTAYRESFDEIRSRFHAILESETRVMLEWTSDCRTTAGVETQYGGVSVVETRDGRIVRFGAYFDPARLTAHPRVETEARASGRPPLADAPPADRERSADLRREGGGADASALS
ncbi:nuclear transport factor 2 family protein [Roseisolibacter sp. H3M3-2]|uniref:nuclear transport factor 2 family protein n=1 Tax=Roseisolibacter sp. H3M3-2 TaxID=3031323 RepID=UPI0023DC3736|nr:nuclear transport factor 2 family protein [Roseisolibacter sp. H3M3-2]MDF1502086.1 nuclear transport factor 2 family protein [Roseisolibacter sp. H3M3-2]